MGRNGRRSAQACLLVACLLMFSAGCRTASHSTSVLDNVEAVRTAAANPSNYGKPLRIEGVVTYCDPDWHLLFLQDATGGLFVKLAQEGTDLQAGQSVEVSGTLAPGNRGIDDAHFRVLGPAPMPAAQQLPDSTNLAQVKLSQWVELHGTVRASSLEDGRFTLTVVDGARRTRVRILTSKRVRPINYVGAEVAITGVSAAMVDEKANTTGIQVFVSSLDQVKLLGNRSLVDPFTRKADT